MSGRNGLRRRLLEPATLFGTWVNGRDPAAVETLGAVGFDVLVVDLEHGELGTPDLPDLLRGADVSGANTIARVSHLEGSQITKVLDAGAEGVIVPNVVSAAEAREAVAAAHYAPRGHRGAAPTGRGARYGATPFPEYRERADTDTVVVTQVERPEGIAALEEILEVEGVDLVFLGPFDLSQHLGIPGQMDHPRLAEALEDIVEAAAAHGIATGTWAPNAALARRWAQAGVKLVTVSNSTSIFTEAATALLAELRGPG